MRPAAGSNGQGLPFDTEAAPTVYTALNFYLFAVLNPDEDSALPEPFATDPDDGFVFYSEYDLDPDEDVEYATKRQRWRSDAPLAWPTDWARLRCWAIHCARCTQRRLLPLRIPKLIRQNSNLVNLSLHSGCGGARGGRVYGGRGLGLRIGMLPSGVVFAFRVLA